MEKQIIIAKERTLITRGYEEWIKISDAIEKLNALLNEGFTDLKIYTEEEWGFPRFEIVTYSSREETEDEVKARKKLESDNATLKELAKEKKERAIYEELKKKFESK